MKKLIFLLLLIPAIVKAQIPALNDTVKISGTSSITPAIQFSLGSSSGYRVPYMTYPGLQKSDFIPTGKYLREFYMLSATDTLTSSNDISFINNKGRLTVYHNQLGYVKSGNYFYSQQQWYFYQLATFAGTGAYFPWNTSILFGNNSSSANMSIVPISGGGNITKKLQWKNGVLADTSDIVPSVNNTAIVKVQDTTGLKSYSGTSTTLQILDVNTAGVFKYVASGLTINGGTVFTATGKGSGYWQRQYSGDVNIRWFGVKGDGTTDDRPAMQNVVNYLALLQSSQPVTIYAPSGTYYMNSAYANIPSYLLDPTAKLGLPLPVNTSNYIKIRGDGIGRTIFKLSNNCVNLFWVNKQADYDVFRNYTFQDFSIDNNNSTGNSHILIGTKPWASASYYTQTRMNIESITVNNVSIYNVPSISTLTTSKEGVYFGGDTPASGEATQIHITDLNISNSSVSGGDGAFQAYSNRWNTSFWTNCYYNNINFINCSHTIPGARTSGTATSFYIGGSGFGDNFTIESCSSTGIGDDAIELGFMSNGIIRDCNFIDPNNEAIFISNDQPATVYPNFTSINNHKTLIENTRVTITSALTGTSGYFARPLRIGSGTSVQFGKFIVNDFTVSMDGINVSTHGAGGSSDLIFTSQNNPFISIVFNRPKIYISNFTNDVSANTDQSLFRFSNTYSNQSKIIVNDAYLSVQATSTSTGNAGFHGFKIEGLNTNVNIDGVAVDYGNITTTHITPRVASIGYYSGGSGIRTDIKRINILSSASTMTGVAQYGSSSIASVNVYNNMFTNLTGTDIDVSSAGSNLPYFKAYNNSLHTGSPYGNYATGDLIYRDANGNDNRLGVGTSTQFLGVSGGLPSWVTPSSLTAGTGLSGTAFNATSAQTFSINQAFTPTWTGFHTFNYTTTSSAGLARGTLFNPSLTASANNDVLVGVDLQPSFNNLSFTGVLDYGLRVNANTNLLGNVDVGAANGRYVGFNNFTSGQTVDFRFGDVNTRVSTTFGSQMHVTAYHGIVIENNTGAGVVGAGLAVYGRNSSRNIFELYNNTTQFGAVYQSGNMGLQNGGTFTDDGVNRLQISGNIKASGLNILNGFSDGELYNSSLVSSAGSSTTNFINISPTYNLTGSYNGTTRGIYYNPTVTSNTGNNIAFEATSGTVIAPVFKSTATKTLVNGSTSGTAQFSQPHIGDASIVMVNLTTLVGTASYTFPVAFGNTPVVLTTNGLSSSVVTSLSTTSVTVTGTTSSGVLIIMGY